MEKETASLSPADRRRACDALVRLLEIMARLRGPGGCPWDAKQTDTTIKAYLLEEAYEVLEAVERASAMDVCQELGDLLFQIIFLARLAEERGDFDLTDVMEGIAEKMIRRHPHVFGDAHVEGAEEVATNWEKIKRSEKGHEPLALKSIPAALPALLRCHRITERALKAGLPVPGAEEALSRIEQALEALKDCKGEAARGEEALGELLFSAASLSRSMGFNAEHLLRIKNDSFIRKAEAAVQDLALEGKSLEDATEERIREAFGKAQEPHEVRSSL
jgi:tetrapyrrole methylase family protein/MazG family protein/ATP diphosphatase